MDITDFEGHELIKTGKCFWVYDLVLSNGRGRPVPVYFDRTSNIYRVFNFPTKGREYTAIEIPPNGLYDLSLDDPLRFTRDDSTDLIKVNIREI